MNQKGSTPWFGFDAAISGPRIVVGGLSRRAWVFHEQAGAWALESMLLPGPDASGSSFGEFVGIDGDVILVGGRGSNMPDEDDTGTAFLFERVSSGWERIDRFAPQNSTGGDQFGAALALENETALITARGIAPTVLDERVFHYTITAEPGLPFCQGQGCPCGNDESTGAGCTNSTGQGASVTGTGTRSVAADDLVLTASGYGPGESGLFFVGADSRPPIAVGDGLASTDGLFRFLPSMTSGAGDLSLSGIVAAAPTGTITAGDTRFFQAWCRDVLCGPPPAPCPSPCGQNSNVSSGYAVLFTPKLRMGASSAQGRNSLHDSKAGRSSRCGRHS